MHKLIETALPLRDIQAMGLRERTGAPGHPANLHMWWGRSPLVSTSVALRTALVDAPDSREELHSRLERAMAGSFADLGEKPAIFDPFSGFGGIPLVAQQMDLPVIAGDLNPVAVMLTKAAVEIPATFSNRQPVNPMSLVKNYTGTAGLAEDVAYYGEWMIQAARERLSELYPNEPDGQPMAWIWARTVRCPNPACGCQMPLASNFVLYGKAGNEIWVEPVHENGKIRFEIRNGSCQTEQASNKIGKQGAIFRCPVCGSLTTDSYVKQMGKEHQLGAQMMAVVIDTPNGKQYLAPNSRQEIAADVPVPEDIPHGEIPDNLHWFSPPGFGMSNFADLFSPRQLTFLTTACDLLKEVQDKVASDALAAGMSESGGSLSEGGAGALAYGQAVSIYLAFVIDKLADANSTICSWRTSGGGLRNTFGRQSIPMTWTYAEGNPFSGITGNFSGSLKNVVAAIKKLPGGSHAAVYQGDAVTTQFPENVLVCTELPYYKSIGYAHLSDFFYIWMRQSLKAVFPELFSQMVTSKEELSTVGQYYGADPETCDREYKEKLQIVLEKLHQCAAADYPSLLFYELHKADIQAWEFDGADSNSISPWATIMEQLNEVGFSVTAVWPMRASTTVDNADGLRVLIVVRKNAKSGQTTKRGFINTLKRELPLLLERRFSAGVDEEDQLIAGIGCGLDIFTKFQRVINADGTTTNVRDALHIISQEIKEWMQSAAANAGETVEED